MTTRGADVEIKKRKQNKWKKKATEDNKNVLFKNKNKTWIMPLSERYNSVKKALTLRTLSGLNLRYRGIMILSG